MFFFPLIICIHVNTIFFLFVSCVVLYIKERKKKWIPTMCWRFPLKRRNSFFFDSFHSHQQQVIIIPPSTNWSPIATSDIITVASYLIIIIRHTHNVKRKKEKKKEKGKFLIFWWVDRAIAEVCLQNGSWNAGNNISHLSDKFNCIIHLGSIEQYFLEKTQPCT